MEFFVRISEVNEKLANPAPLGLLGFGMTTVLFLLLTAKESTASTDLSIIAGYEGIICGLSAFYLALAEVLNGIYGKTLLPV